MAFKILQCSFVFVATTIALGWASTNYTTKRGGMGILSSGAVHDNNNNANQPSNSSSIVEEFDSPYNMTGYNFTTTTGTPKNFNATKRLREEKCNCENNKNTSNYPIRPEKQMNGQFNQTGAQFRNNNGSYQFNRTYSGQSQNGQYQYNGQNYQNQSQYQYQRNNSYYYNGNNSSNKYQYQGKNSSNSFSGNPKYRYDGYPSNFSNPWDEYNDYNDDNSYYNYSYEEYNWSNNPSGRPYYYRDNRNKREDYFGQGYNNRQMNFSNEHNAMQFGEMRSEPRCFSELLASGLKFLFSRMSESDYLGNQWSLGVNGSYMFVEKNSELPEHKDEDGKKKDKKGKKKNEVAHLKEDGDSSRGSKISGKFAVKSFFYLRPMELN